MTDTHQNLGVHIKTTEEVSLGFQQAPSMQRLVVQFISTGLALVKGRRGVGIDGCEFESKICFWYYLDRVLK